MYVSKRYIKADELSGYLSEQVDELTDSMNANKKIMDEYRPAINKPNFHRDYYELAKRHYQDAMLRRNELGAVAHAMGIWSEFDSRLKDELLK